MVGHLLWYHPAILKLKELLDSGELGRLQYIYSNRLNLGKIRREENILWSFAPHDISVILGLVGEMPDDIVARGGNYLHDKISDVTVSILSFPSGVKSHIFVSWLHPYKEQKLVVVGDKQMAVFDDIETFDKLVLYPHSIEWKNHLPVPHKSEGEVVELEMSEPLRAECMHFIDCMRTGKTPRTDAAEALRVLSVLTVCQASLDEGYTRDHRSTRLDARGGNGDVFANATITAAAEREPPPPVARQSPAEFDEWLAQRPVAAQTAAAAEPEPGTGETPVTSQPSTSDESRIANHEPRPTTDGSPMTSHEPSAISNQSLPYKVHESAYIDAGSNIGEGTTIWHFSHVLRNCSIGRDCRIGQNVVIGPAVRIGNNVKIQNNVSVYEGVELEDNVFCGPSMVFTNVYNPRSEIRRMDELRRTLVRKGATLGANSTILCGTTIGEYAFIGAGAVVLKDVPDYALVVGNPGRIAGWMCVCGNRIEFDGKKGECPVCSRSYRLKKGEVTLVQDVVQTSPSSA
jgi:acetyltransferase-like isoleucine patch superfamily enzyme